MWDSDHDGDGTAIAWRVMAEDWLYEYNVNRHGYPTGIEWLWAEDAHWRAERIAELEAALEDARERLECQYDRAESNHDALLKAESALKTAQDYLRVSSDPPCPDVCTAYRDLDHRATEAEAELEWRTAQRDDLNKWLEKTQAALDYFEVWFENLYPADYERCVEKYEAFIRTAAAREDS